MKRSILMSLLVIGAVAALLGFTVAPFSDTETSTGNEFAAGTLNLSLGSSSPLPIVLREMAPGVESAGQTITMTNTGTLPGSVNWEITNVVESDGSSGTPANSVNVNAADFADSMVVSYVYFDRDTDNNLAEPGGGDGSDYTFTPTGVCSGITSPVTDVIWAGLTAAERACIVNNSTWQGAPGGINDEWVMPDWMRWGDKINGDNDGNLTIGEIDAMAAGSWNLDDIGGTSKLDGGETYTHVLKFTLDDSLYSGDPNDLQADGIEVTVTVTLTQ